MEQPGAALAYRSKRQKWRVLQQQAGDISTFVKELDLQKVLGEPEKEAGTVACMGQAPT